MAQSISLMMFSVILPTYNRAFCICKAIDSALRQDFADWELVIADDGSTDGTEALLRERYAEQFASGRFVYLRQDNAGVCRARNLGLSAARGEWIAYLDSDNTVRPDFLRTFAEAIGAHPRVETFYAKFANVCGGAERGGPFDWDGLLSRNFIDLGVFVHHRRLVGELGGFDEAFRRLVDWELILRYTRRHPPVFIDRVLMDYNNSADFARITGSWLGNQDWKAAVISKHGGHLPLITTVITSYNHRDYIAEAIESAMRQEGPFRREIIVSDDGSTDGTAEIAADFAEKFPHLVRNASSAVNVGISANMRKCFAEARGDYVAVLEGDDFWSCRDKLARQLAFLAAHAECPMAFSRTTILDANGVKRYSRIQESLPALLTGRDMFAAGSSSVILNFSSCIFRASALRDLPGVLWSYRLSEIALAFYLERRGPIGYLPEPMSVYRQHATSEFTGAGFIGRRRQEIACREIARQVCAPEYVADFDREIARIDDVIRRRLEHVDKPSCRTCGWVAVDVFRNALRCYRENGLAYTLRRIFFGRQY